MESIGMEPSPRGCATIAGIVQDHDGTMDGADVAGAIDARPAAQEATDPSSRATG
jgi:hypothetical protein